MDSVKTMTANLDKRHIVLIIYDIVDNKRRYRMVKCLEGYGIRVQRSAFEAYVTRKKYEKLVRETSSIIDREEDSLRIYLLSKNTSVLTWGKVQEWKDDVIIV